MPAKRKITRKSQAQLMRDAWACIGHSRLRKSKRNAVIRNFNFSGAGTKKRRIIRRKGVRGGNILDSLAGLFS